MHGGSVGAFEPTCDRLVVCEPSSDGRGVADSRAHRALVARADRVGLASRRAPTERPNDSARSGERQLALLWRADPTARAQPGRGPDRRGPRERGRREDRRRVRRSDTDARRGVLGNLRQRAVPPPAVLTRWSADGLLYRWAARRDRPRDGPGQAALPRPLRSTTEPRPRFGPIL